jgi:hypothetical protein
LNRDVITYFGNLKLRPPARRSGQYAIWARYHRAQRHAHRNRNRRLRHAMSRARTGLIADEQAVAGAIGWIERLHHQQ